MSLGAELFGKKAAAPVQRPSAVTPTRTAAPSAPTKPKPVLPGSPEAWAQDLKAKKDYAALAAVTFESFNDQSWPKVRLAQTILKEAGTEAVDAILQQVKTHGHCGVELASTLVDIGDPRAVPFLKKDLLALSANWTAAGMFSVYWPTQGTSRNTTGQTTFLFDRQLTAPWDAFIEYAGSFPQRGGPQHILHFGTAYKLTPKQQLDFHIGVGLSSAAPGHFVGVGYSFLLHDKS